MFEIDFFIGKDTYVLKTTDEKLANEIRASLAESVNRQDANQAAREKQGSHIPRRLRRQAMRRKQKMGL